jgi:hypothetical protein
MSMKLPSTVIQNCGACLRQAVVSSTIIGQVAGEMRAEEHDLSQSVPPGHAASSCFSPFATIRSI